MGHQLENFSSDARYGHVDPTTPALVMDLSDIQLPDDVRVFACGPLGFMRNIRSELMQRVAPAHHIPLEVFGSDLWIAQTG